MIVAAEDAMAGMKSLAASILRLEIDPIDDPKFNRHPL
jgi:hypothetical protein